MMFKLLGFALFFSIELIEFSNQHELCIEGHNYKYNTTKYCLLRENYYEDVLWTYWSGFYCYFYTDTSRFEEKYPLQTQTFSCEGIINYVTLPVMRISDTSFALFNYSSYSLDAIEKSFKRNSKFFASFLECWTEGNDCCKNKMFANNSNIINTPDMCPVIWDSWSCFPQTPVNTTAHVKCSNQAYQSPESVCSLLSEKYCVYDPNTSLAQWNQDTNYNVCLIGPVYQNRHEYHVLVLYISTFLSVPAIIIFCSFKKFRNDTRIILHRNLLLAICIRNIFTIMSKYIVILDALKGSNESNNVMSDNSVGCRFLAACENAAKNAIYATMLVDGFYLHKLIVRAFASDPKMVWLYTVVGVLTFLPTMIWSIVMAVDDQDNCWMVVGDEQWIVDGIRIAILVINTLLLIDIIRVLISKMNKRSTSRQTKAAFRATLFLIPLFGLHIAVTARPILLDDTCYSEDIYNYVRYSIEAFQGVMVSILFCYVNTEVHTQFKNSYRKFKIYLEQKYNIILCGISTTNERGRSRITTATIVGELEMDEGPMVNPSSGRGKGPPSNK